MHRESAGKRRFGISRYLIDQATQVAKTMTGRGESVAPIGQTDFFLVADGADLTGYSVWYQLQIDERVFFVVWENQRSG